MVACELLYPIKLCKVGPTRQRLNVSIFTPPSPASLDCALLTIVWRLNPFMVANEYLEFGTDCNMYFNNNKLLRREPHLSKMIFRRAILRIWRYHKTIHLVQSKDSAASLFSHDVSASFLCWTLHSYFEGNYLIYHSYPLAFLLIGITWKRCPANTEVVFIGRRGLFSGHFSKLKK